LFDDGEQSRDFTYIDDVLQANLDAAKYEGNELVFNIGGGSRVSMNQVIEKMESILGKSLKVERGPRQKGDVKHTGADTSRAREGFGYSPKVSLEEGLKAEADWLEQVVIKSGS
jgi:nucleoside-diphosphate-sugar epimerase